MSKKITELTLHSNLIGEDLLPVVDATANETKKMYLGKCLNLPGTNFAFVNGGNVSFTQDAIEQNSLIQPSGGSVVYDSDYTYTYSNTGNLDQLLNIRIPISVTALVHGADVFSFSTGHPDFVWAKYSVELLKDMEVVASFKRTADFYLSTRETIMKDEQVDSDILSCTCVIPANTSIDFSLRIKILEFVAEKEPAARGLTIRIENNQSLNTFNTTICNI